MIVELKCSLKLGETWDELEMTDRATAVPTTKLLENNWPFSIQFTNILIFSELCEIKFQRSKFQNSQYTHRSSLGFFDTWSLLGTQVGQSLSAFLWGDPSASNVLRHYPYWCCQSCWSQGRKEQPPQGHLCSWIPAPPPWHHVGAA